MWLALLVGLLLQSNSANRAIQAVMPEAKVLRRAAVTSDLDVVIATSGPKLGLFAQGKANPGRVYLLDMENHDAGCATVMERITPTDAVLSCITDSAARGQSWKFIYDLRARSLVRQFHYAPFSVYRIFPEKDGAVFVECDREKLLVVEYRPDREPLLQVLTEQAARPWLARVPTDIGFEGQEMKRVISIPPDRTPVPEALVSSLRESTYDQFAAARPERVKNGYVREGTGIHESIGPWQKDGDRIWFAKSFYDGEGSTGTGGLDISTAPRARRRCSSRSIS